MGLQSIGAAQLVAAQPIGTSAIRFSGYSSLGNYTHTTSLPTGSYLFYPVAANKNSEFLVWSSNNNKSIFAVNDAANLIKLTTTESSFNIIQYGVYSKNATTFSNSNLDAVVYGNSIYVMGGENGALATSTDGISWTTRNSSLGVTQIYGLSYGSGVFVCAARGGLLSSSTDGITWTTRNSLATADLNFARYVNGYHYVGGGSGVLRSSTDGITWSTASQHTMTTYDIAYGVVGGTGYYVLVGNSGYLSSGTNGTTWTSRTSGFGSTDIRAVTYGNGLFVAAGGAGVLRTSNDAINWTSRNSNFGTSTIWGLTYYNGLFIAVGDGGTVRTSTDGITWTTRAVAQSTTGTFKNVVVGTQVVIPVSGTNQIYNSVSETQFALYDTASSSTLN